MNNIRLEAYEGPLDLLLGLITKNEIDIYDIPISEITSQYMDFIYSADDFDIETAAEFIVTAAQLIEIKSKMMLPSEETEDEEDFDPREELVRRLVEYKIFKMIGDYLKPYENEYSASLSKDPSYIAELSTPSEITNLEADILAAAVRNLLLKNKIKIEAPKDTFSVDAGVVPVEEKIEGLQKRLLSESEFTFTSAFGTDYSRSNIVAVFLAVLELFKRNLISLSQNGTYDEITIARSENSAVG